MVQIARVENLPDDMSLDEFRNTGLDFGEALMQGTQGTVSNPGFFGVSFCHIILATKK